MTIQDRHPNFRENGKLYLVRCFKCEPERGIENYLPAVAKGQCTWCGYKENNEKKTNKKAVKKDVVKTATKTKS